LKRRDFRSLAAKAGAIAALGSEMIGSVAIPVILFLSLAEAEPARRVGRRVREPKLFGFLGT
jgi:hypothetical protein